MSELMQLPAHEVTPVSHRRLERAMAQAGWFIDYVDLDLTRARPVATIKCHRDDGRWLRADIDGLGRCTLETFHRNSWLGRPDNVKGRWPMSPQVDDLFLGRAKPTGPRAMLRAMIAYIVGNASGTASLADMRAAWVGVMGGPTKIEHQNEGSAS